MKYSQLFGKTQKQDPKDEVSTNAKLLIRGGFISKLMAGSYSIMPLGYRVLTKIENIIRKEMNSTGAQEILMPLLHPKSIWNETGRWEKAKEVMYQFKKDEREYALSFTHEEILLDLARKYVKTYRDFPIKLYHFSTKFRDELRAKSGLLRGREFLMKDLYSLHVSKEELDKYYWEVAKVYMNVFRRVGLNAKVVEAGGGVFTDENTHEFQVVSDDGEDTIYWCNKCDFAKNREILTIKEGSICPNCKKGEVRMSKSIEVGNIFRFGTVYSEKMNVSFVDPKGKKQLAYFGSYGIGTTRLMGAIVEVYNDDNGIIWPKTVSPYEVHLVHIEDPRTEPWAKETYGKLTKAGIEVLWDDREDVTAGEKFADCDLIGIPTRLVVSKKTGKGKVEVKERNKEKTKSIPLDRVVSQLKS